MNTIDYSHLQAILNYVADHSVAKFEIWQTRGREPHPWYASIKYQSSEDVYYDIPWDEVAQPSHDESGATLSEVLQRMSYWVGQQMSGETRNGSIED